MTVIYGCPKSSALSLRLIPRATPRWIGQSLILDSFVVVPSSVRPKPGFGIGNRNQGPILVLLLEPIFFSRKGLFNNYVDKISGEGDKKCLFLSMLRV